MVIEDFDWDADEVEDLILVVASLWFSAHRPDFGSTKTIWKQDDCTTKVM